MKNGLFMAVILVLLAFFSYMYVQEERQYTYTTMTYLWPEIPSAQGATSTFELKFEYPLERQDIDHITLSNPQVKYSKGCRIASPNRSNYSKPDPTTISFADKDWHIEGDSMYIYLHAWGSPNPGFEIYSGETCHTNIFTTLHLYFAKDTSVTLKLKTPSNRFAKKMVAYKRLKQAPQ